MRVELQAGYILHSRPFRDSSLIVDCLTPDYGRIALLAKGARSTKSRQRHLLQPLVPVTLCWQGKSELKTLTQIEPTSLRLPLVGKALYSALYINELLTRLLPQQDSLPEVLPCYERALASLFQQDAQESRALEPILRRFELELLALLGYEINLYTEVGSGDGLQPGHYYQFLTEQGFSRLTVWPSTLSETQFSGEDLLAIAQGDFSLPEVLSSAKRLSRIVLQPLLGAKPLQSRALFKDVYVPTA